MTEPEKNANGLYPDEPIDTRTHGRPEMTEPEKNANSLYPDEPIDTSEEDLFGFKRSVEGMAEEILAIEKNKSMIIALNGAWGTGKSSFLNLLEKQLNKNQPNENQPNKDDNKKPIVIRFNPWNYSSVDQLITMFFTELKTGIGHMDHKEDLINLLNKMNALISPRYPLIGAVRAVFRILNILFFL